MPIAENRVEQGARAIRSVLNQQYPHFELIVVNDFSGDETAEMIEGFRQLDKRVKVVTHSQSMNRAISRNDGMDMAENDWICWLDSDDEYVSHYLRELDKAIKDFPEYKIFNFPSMVYYPDHRWHLRETFYPKIEGNGHEWFPSGRIGSGSFIFRRDLWNSDKKYRIPDEQSPYAFAANSGIDMKFPPNHTINGDLVEGPSEMAFKDKKMRVGISLGNPWGDDYLQCYLLTRDNHMKPLDIPLYIQYPWTSENDYEYFRTHLHCHYNLA